LSTVYSRNGERRIYSNGGKEFSDGRNT